MPTKIRLQRRGKKKQAFYHIVVADGRAPRDGRNIERIGVYNPVTVPATIELNFDRALEWVMSGAQPSDTVRAILSYKGVMMKKHLLEGVKKGALTEEQAETKFKSWLTEKEAKINNAKKSHTDKLDEAEKARLAEEKKINEARAEEIAKRRADELEEEVKKRAEEEGEAEETEEAKEEKTEETPEDNASEEASEDKKEE